MSVVTSPDEPALEEWIRRHRVSYEVSPHVEMRGHERASTGYDVALHAARTGPCTRDPGCPSCHEIHGGLARILRGVVPDGVPYDIAPFDASFHLRPETQWESEIELIAQIPAPRGAAAPAEPADLERFGAVRAALERLGVRPRRWGRP